MTRSKIVDFAAAFSLVLSPMSAFADPARLHALETGHLLPASTLEFRLGSHQADASQVLGGQGTGLQVYEASAAYAASDWQFGLRFSSYDDVPPAPIAGNYGHLSLIGIGLDLKKELVRQDNFAWAAAVSVEGLAFGSRTPKDDSVDHLSFSLRAPMSIRLTDMLEAHLDPSLVDLPDQFKGAEGFGINAFLGAGLSWQATDRLLAYVDLTVPISGNGNTLDTDGNVVRAMGWSLGARYRIAPAGELDVYATNRVAGTAASSGVVLPPMGSTILYGVQLIYQPGRKDPTFQLLPAAILRPAEGFLLTSGAVLPEGDMRIKGSAGASGGMTGAVSFSPDQGLQFDAILERHAAANATYSVPPGTDPLFMFGGRFQALYPSHSFPLWLSAGILAGRTLDFDTRPWEPGRPTVGFIYGDIAASRVLWRRTTVTLQARGSAWRNEVLAGLGVGGVFQWGETLDLVAEASINSSGPTTWASGLRWKVTQDLSASLLATNAIGANGHGALLAAETPGLQLRVASSF